MAAIDHLNVTVADAVNTASAVLFFGRNSRLDSGCQPSNATKLQYPFKFSGAEVVPIQCPLNPQTNGRRP